MRSALLGLLALAMLASTASSQQVDTTHRNPFVAGTLSFFLPGAGSLYAGNSRHSLVHAGVAIASIAGMRSSASSDPSDNTASGAGSFLAFAVNTVWSVVTAVHDANDFNAHRGDSIKRVRRPYGIAHAHLGIGGGRVPYLGDAIGGHTTEVRLGLAFNAFPQWTLALASNAVKSRAGTGYYVQACASGRGCLPKVSVSTTGLEVQRRWWNDRAIHPVATVGAGNLNTSYSYPVKDQWPTDHVEDSVQTRRYVSAGVGVEGNLGSWIHGAVIAGYRATGARTIPRASSSNTGPTLLWLVEIGRP